jgi:hypothetical protein
MQGSGRLNCCLKMQEHWLILIVLHFRLQVRKNILRMQQHMRFISTMFPIGEYDTLRNNFASNGVIGERYTLYLRATIMGKVDSTYAQRISLFHSSIIQAGLSLSKALQTIIYSFANEPSIYVAMSGRKLWRATTCAGTVLMVSYNSHCNAASCKISGLLITNTPLSNIGHSGSYVVTATVSLG